MQWRRQLLQPEYGDGQHQDDHEQQRVILVDSEAPGPALPQRLLAVGVISGRTVQKERLDEACEYAEGEANALCGGQDLSSLLRAFKLTELDYTAEKAIESRVITSIPYSDRNIRQQGRR